MRLIILTIFLTLALSAHQSQSKVIFGGDDWCTQGELDDMVQKIEALYGKLKSGEDYISYNEQLHYNYRNNRKIISYNGVGVEVELSPPDSDVTFSYVFHANNDTQRLKDQCTTLKAYKLKIARLVRKYGNMKHLLEKYIIRNNLSGLEVYRTDKRYGHAEKWNVHKRFCNKRLFRDPVSRIEVDSYPSLNETFFKSFDSADTPNLTPKVAKLEERLERLLIHCVYTWGEPHTTNKRFPVIFNRKVQVENRSGFMVHRKKEDWE